jgi:hypothetical protein
LLLLSIVEIAIAFGLASFASCGKKGFRSLAVSGSTARLFLQLRKHLQSVHLRPATRQAQAVRPLYFVATHVELRLHSQHRVGSVMFSSSLGGSA